MKYKELTEFWVKILQSIKDFYAKRSNELLWKSTKCFQSGHQRTIFRIPKLLNTSVALLYVLIKDLLEYNVDMILAAHES